MPSFADAVARWHDFYALIGTAAATLVGLLFVAASVASGAFARGNRAALRVFLTQSVVHFASVLAAALVALAPVGRFATLAVLIGGLGTLGLVYCGLVWRSLLGTGLGATIDTEDRVCYAVLPALGYLALLGAGAALGARSTAGLDVLALGMGLLLAVGIRNAWDITIWTVTRGRE